MTVLFTPALVGRCTSIIVPYAIEMDGVHNIISEVPNRCSAGGDRATQKRPQRYLRNVLTFCLSVCRSCRDVQTAETWSVSELSSGWLQGDLDWEEKSSDTYIDRYSLSPMTAAFIPALFDRCANAVVPYAKEIDRGRPECDLWSVVEGAAPTAIAGHGRE